VFRHLSRRERENNHRVWSIHETYLPLSREELGERGLQPALSETCSADLTRAL
jgi:hypothetical protein